MQRILAPTVLLIAFILQTCRGCVPRCKCDGEKVTCIQFSTHNLRNISFAALPVTRKLYLLNGGIVHFPVLYFKRLKQLEYLNLYMNRIKTLPKKMSESFPNLKKLYVSSNAIENLTLLHGYENLESLKLDENNIKELRPHTFQSLKNLRELTLHKNEIHSIPQMTFAGLDNLRKLDLRNNRIAWIHERAFSHLPKVEEILLDENDLTTLRSTMFVANTKLRRLSLSENRIETIERGTFGGLEKLVDISLRSNALTQLSWLNELKINHKIYLTKNPFICNCRLLVQLKTSARQLHENRKLALGNCRTPNDKVLSIRQLNINNYQCTACDASTCEENSECIAANNATYEYRCRTIKRKAENDTRHTTNSTTVPTNSSASVLASEDKKDMVVAVCIVGGVCVVVLCALLIWLLWQHKRRKSTFHVSDVTNMNEFDQDDVLVKGKNVSSVNLILVTSTEYDNDALMNPS